MAETIITTEYSSEMRKSFINYSMSVITARAVPDVRDGLKPVQRRVLFAMDELGLNADKPHRKSARIVGDAMGKYHPHGDSSIYDALVVLSQDFKKGMALVDGHGNFGSIEGDGAAAMRYTEARLKKFTQEVYLADLDKNIVDFVPNFDETEKEPSVLPVRVPNFLINGSEGIAVGMTTSTPPHNLGEIINAEKLLMEFPNATTADLLDIIEGPDFPTGGIVTNKDELLSIYETGRGKIRIRGKAEIVRGKRKSDRDKIVITEIPYTMVGANIGKFLNDVASLVETKKTTDIVDISNQSSKEGIRIVLELKKDADVNRIKAILYKKTKLEDTYGVNMLAIDEGRPETMNLKQILNTFLEFQYRNMTKKYNVLLQKEMEKKEVQEGLIEACDVIDLIIAVLRGSKNMKDAKECLMTGNTEKIKFRVPGFEADAKNLHFTERQATAILEMRLYKLIGLEILALQKAYKETLRKIREYKHILSNQKNMDVVIKEDLDSIKAEFAEPRRTLIEDGEEMVYVEAKEEAKEVIFVMDRFGYCKTMDRSIYERNQETVDSENVWVLPVMTDDKLCMFSDTGNMYQVKVAEFPTLKMKDKGIPIENVSKFDGKTETILFMLPASGFTGKKFLFATAQAAVKIVPGEEFITANKTVVATKLAGEDKLTEIREIGTEIDGTRDVVLQTVDGMFLKFQLEEIPELKKNSRGVRGIRLEKEDTLEHVYLPDMDGTAVYKGKEVALGRLKVAKRDGKGTKIRL